VKLTTRPPSRPLSAARLDQTRSGLIRGPSQYGLLSDRSRKKCAFRVRKSVERDSRGGRKAHLKEPIHRLPPSNGHLLTLFISSSFSRSLHPDDYLPPLITLNTYLGCFEGLKERIQERAGGRPEDGLSPHAFSSSLLLSPSHPLFLLIWTGRRSWSHAIMFWRSSSFIFSRDGGMIFVGTRQLTPRRLHSFFLPSLPSFLSFHPSLFHPFHRAGLALTSVGGDGIGGACSLKTSSTDLNLSRSQVFRPSPLFFPSSPPSSSLFFVFLPGAVYGITCLAVEVGRQ